MKDSVLLFLVVFPLVGAFVSYLIGKKNKSLRDYFAAFVCIRVGENEPGVQANLSVQPAVTVRRILKVVFLK